MAGAIRALEGQEPGPMEINGQCRRGVHIVYGWTPANCWRFAKTFYSLADAKTYSRKLSARLKIRVRLVSYWAEKVEELENGSYVNSWEAAEADWT